MLALDWSSTSSRTSTRSSTSDGPAQAPAAAARVAGLIRLIHPFPCLLDGVVVGAVALVAGADGLAAVRLGLAMTALQASIGALNDTIDAPRDAGRKPGKPIPSGLVSMGLARGAVVATAGLGIVLIVPAGGATVGLALAVLAIGYGYDIAFKGTAWSWLPFAIGIPLLPAFGWLGTAGMLPAPFAILEPVAVVAGAALAIANARADEERDVAAGVTSVAVRLGSARSWVVNAGLLIVVAVAAGVTLVAGGQAPAAALVAATAAGAIIAAGIAIGRDGDSSRRERAWELQAIGVGLLAAAWLAGIRLGG